MVRLRLELLAGETELLGVDDDDEFAGVDVRRVFGSVLAAEDGGDLDRQPADDLVGRVDDEPALLHLVRLRHKCGHDAFISSKEPSDGKNYHKGFRRVVKGARGAWEREQARAKPRRFGRATIEAATDRGPAHSLG